MRRLTRELTFSAAVVVSALAAILVHLRLHPLTPPEAAPWQVCSAVRERYGSIPFDTYCRPGLLSRRCYAVLRDHGGADVLPLDCPLLWRCTVPEYKESP